MEGKGIKNLKILRFVRNYHLSCKGHVMLPLKVLLLSISAFSITIPISSPVIESQGVTDTIKSETDDFDNIQKIEKNDFERYLDNLSISYNIEKEKLRILIDENIETLLQQEDLSSAIAIMIEQNIENGTLIQETIEEKRKIRLTTYQYTPDASEKMLGGSIGLISPYLEEGSMYFDENGYAIWKGGTTSKLNGMVYGEEGKDYVVVATATKYLIGQYNYQENENINYYNYNDTFKIDITTKNGEKEYNAIVLDSCGACMDWSVTSDGTYAPKTEKEKKYCSVTNNTKIDLFTAPTDHPNLTDPNDIAYQTKEMAPEVKEIPKLTEYAEKYLITKYFLAINLELPVQKTESKMMDVRITLTR